MNRSISALLVFVLALGGLDPAAWAQQGYIHGNGDPRVITPTPNCGQSRFYIDDSTGQMYTSAQGSPCVWTLPGSGSPTGAAAGDLNGTYPNPGVAKVNGGTVPASQPCLGSDISSRLIAGNCPGATASATINTANAQTQADSVVATTLNSMINFGDSITATAGATVNTKGYTSLIAQDLGLAVANLAPNNQGVAGDDVGDETWHIFTTLNPADSGNAIVTSMIGTNNVGGVTSDYLQKWLAGHSWGSMSSTNKVLAGAAAVTLTGTTAADTTFANANGISCTAGPCTLSLTGYAGTPGEFYVWYKMVSSGANFSTTVDGSAVTDSVTGSSTISTTWAHAPVHQTSTVGVARYPASNTGAAASHAIVVTLQTGGVIIAFGFPPIGRYRGVSHPRMVAAGIPPEQNNANAANVSIVNALNLLGSKLLVADGLDLPFVDANSLDPVLDMAGSALQNCPASTNPGLHPNDCGHRHLAQLFESAIGAANYPANPNWVAPVTTTGQTSPATLPGTANGNDPTSYSGLTGFPKGTWCVDTFSGFCWGITYINSTTFDTTLVANNSSGAVAFSFIPGSATPAQVAAGIKDIFKFDGSATIGAIVLSSTGTITENASAVPANLGNYSSLGGTTTASSTTLMGGVNFAVTGGINAGTHFIYNNNAALFSIGMYAPNTEIISNCFYTGAVSGVTGSSSFSCPNWVSPDGMNHTPAPLSNGTKFTTSGCSISATTGGASAGTFTLGANTCTAIVTLNGATGLTATNGWTCDAHDRTAPTVLIGGESSSTTTTASFTIPAGAGATDVISFKCSAF